MKKPIPVTILTWFLGSGKTTLLNHILKNKEWRKIAVIENEYGEEAIDSQLIEKKFEELIEIKDGCMCCVVRWDLIAGVKKLLDSGKDIDHLIIEASGMSEPAPIAQTFIMETFGGRTRLDGIICVIDAENFHDKIVQSLHTTSEQIENAHFIVLNKAKNVSEAKKDEITRAVKKLNPYSAIIESDYCRVDLDSILEMDISEEDFPKVAQKDKHAKHHHSHDEHSHHEHSHEHDKKEIEKYFFSTQHLCKDIESMKHFLAEVSESVFRIKWLIHFEWCPDARYILQKAGSCFTLWEDPQWDKKERTSKIVFIWKNLNTEEIQDMLLKDIFIAS